MGIIGSAIGAAGSVIGGAMAAKAQKENLETLSGMRDAVAARQQQNQDWFDKEYNADATQRADAQNMIRRTEEAIKTRAKQAAGTAAVMGGSEESMAADKAANAKALTETASNITAAADARKDKVQTQFMSRQDALDGTMRDLQDKEMAANNAKAQAISSAIKGVTDAAGVLPF
ncbi:MAG: hypothetical protein IJR13_07755 [Bacteroidales bacterium]|nr:hypothetical protein [Bacteroidales bacterium]